MDEITHEQASASLEVLVEEADDKHIERLAEYIQQQRTRPPHGGVRWLVYSREHNLWWRSNGAGYAPVIEEAGRYTREEAEQICATAGTGRGRHRDDGDEGPPEFCVPDPLCIVEPSPGVTVAREVLEKVREALEMIERGNWSSPASASEAARNALALLKDSPHA